MSGRFFFWVEVALTAVSCCAVLFAASLGYWVFVAGSLVPVVICAFLAGRIWEAES